MSHTKLKEAVEWKNLHVFSTIFFCDCECGVSKSHVESIGCWTAVIVPHTPANEFCQQRKRFPQNWQFHLFCSHCSSWENFKLIPQRAVGLQQVFVPTKEQRTKVHSFNQLIWVFRQLIGQNVCTWLFGTKTCSHSALCGIGLRPLIVPWKGILLNQPRTENALVFALKLLHLNPLQEKQNTKMHKHNWKTQSVFPPVSPPRVRNSGESVIQSDAQSADLTSVPLERLPHHQRLQRGGGSWANVSRGLSRDHPQRNTQEALR